MSRDIVAQYFNWMCEHIDHDERYNGMSYTDLFRNLYNTDFVYILDMDQNRADDGVDLRYRFGYEMGYPKEVIENKLDNKPCSVLEMMLALSIRCEEDYMDSVEDEGEASKCFWHMMHSLGLIDMTNRNYNTQRVKTVIRKFLNRKYARNGKGGLFTVNNPRTSMRDVEIWYQMMWYLDEYLNLK